MHLLPFLVLIPLVSASSLFSIVLPNRVWAVAGLQARQNVPGGVPTPCKPDCDPVNAEATQGCRPEQCCKASFVTGYYNCLKCVGATLNTTDYSPVQQVLDMLTSTCDARGFDVPKLTLPGIDPDRPLPSATVPKSTVSIGTSAFPNLPSSFTSANGQTTITGAAPTPSPVGPQSEPPPQATNTPSSAITERFLSSHFSHLPASVVLLGGLIYLMI